MTYYIFFKVTYEDKTFSTNYVCRNCSEKWSNCYKCVVNASACLKCSGSYIVAVDA